MLKTVRMIPPLTNFFITYSPVKNVAKHTGRASRGPVYGSYISTTRVDGEFRPVSNDSVFETIAKAIIAPNTVSTAQTGGKCPAKPQLLRTKALTRGIFFLI